MFLVVHDHLQPLLHRRLSLVSSEVLARLPAAGVSCALSDIVMSYIIVFIKFRK